MSRKRGRARGKSSRRAAGPTKGRQHAAPRPPAPARRRRPLAIAIGVAAVVIVAGAAAIAMLVRDNREKPAAAPLRWDVPEPDTARMQPRVAQLIEEKRQAVQRRLDAAEAWGVYGAACDVHDLYDEAAICYDRARLLAPSDFRWPYLLGYVRELQGAGLEQIEQLLHDAARLQPGLPPVFFRLGDALMREGKTREACDAYRKAIELDPGLAIAHRSLGQALNALGEHRDALVHLERALIEGREDGAVYAAMAQAKARLGDSAGAREAAEKSRRTPIALSLPDPVRYEVESLGISSQHCYDRGVGLMQQGDYGGAIEQLEIAKEHLADDPEVQYRLGVCYATTRRQLQAVQHLSEAIRLNPQHAGAHFTLGRLLEAVGSVNEAIGQYRRAVQIDPDHPARERLRALGAQP